MASEKILSKLSVGGEKDYYLLTTVHNGGKEGFDLSLCDGHEAWCGSVTKDDLTKSGSKLKMDFKDYVIQTRKAFTRQNVGGIDFQYTVKNQDMDSVTFTWKKHIATENIKFQLGAVVLNKKEHASDITTLIFEHVLRTTRDLQAQITNLQADKERLMAERQTALKRLEKCVVSKEEMEQDMYSKFVVVVNDKKAKIRNLRDELEAAKSGASSPPETDGAGEGSSRQVASVREESDDTTDDMGDQDSDIDYNTDDEKVPSPAKRTKVMTTARPSTTAEEEDDDSLFLEDRDTKKTPPAPRRRRRQEQTTKKQTPSRPIIPKISSAKKKVESTPEGSTDRKAPLRKGSSNMSSRSSNQIDDLLDEMM